MEVSEQQVFNLWDTNGRRHDVINALEIYMKILQELQTQYPSESWASYPDSIKEFRFYERAIEESSDVFKKTGNYDAFIERLGDNKELFLNKSYTLSKEDATNLDVNIEARARHYTSNLVRIGLTDDERNISQVGYNFLKSTIVRDELEQIFPINDINLILFRQLLKLRIYTSKDMSGKRKYYSPCLMALFLLLQNHSLDVKTFRYIVQGFSPYWADKFNLSTLAQTNLTARDFIKDEVVIPTLFLSETKISKTDFYQYIKNRKSKAVIDAYYQLYCALYEYRNSPNERSYTALRNILLGNDSTKLEKAFGCGNAILNVGTARQPFSYSQFLQANKNVPLLTEPLNKMFYICYSDSKFVDMAQEYSDTTKRMLSATGIFQFGKPLVELSYRQIFETIFKYVDIRNYIMGEATNLEYLQYELGLSSFFRQEKSLTEILNLDKETTAKIISELQTTFGVETDIKQSFVLQNRVSLEKHIEEKYPKEQIIQLLSMIADRNNDKAIREYVNDDASVPTIYEFLVAIAWYYISGKRISVYDSLNLTLNADFEPVIHAAGGAGDIVVNYDNQIVMLEATLMNAAAQKRGEWEPVLRHAINLTAESYPQKVTTLFVADTLDYNTINIWRAVAAVSLQSSTTGDKTEHVVIMPFTNNNLCYFMQHNISDQQIISAIEHSYNQINSSFDDTWREEILTDLTL